MNVDQIICGDNATVLRGLPEACVDLTVTSPPYDNLRTYNGYTWDFEALARELYRVTKPGGVVVWVVGDATVDGSETLTSFKQALFFRECGFNVETMIYQKDGTGATGGNKFYLQVTEYMFVLSRGIIKTSNLLRDRKNVKKPGTVNWIQGKRLKDGTPKGKRKWDMVEYGIRFNIWKYSVGKGSAYSDDYVREHPAVFPEVLARDHILSWSNPGNLVLDPFVGSGTTAKMAKETGRHWLGIDISEEYCRLAERRVLGANVPLPGLV